MQDWEQEMYMVHSKAATYKKRISKAGKISVQKYFYYVSDLIYSSTTDADQGSAR